MNERLKSFAITPLIWVVFFVVWLIFSVAILLYVILYPFLALTGNITLKLPLDIVDKRS